MSVARRHSVTSAKLHSSCLRLAALLAATFLIGCADPAIHPSATLTPDAQIAIGTGSLLGQLGFSSAEGILVCNDREYRVFLNGLDSSARQYAGSGRIYNLSRPENIDGDYRSQDDGRLLTSSSGIQIVVSPPLTMRPGTGHLQIEYGGRIFPRSVQTYPLQSDQ